MEAFHLTITIPYIQHGNNLIYTLAFILNIHGRRLLTKSISFELFTPVHCLLYYVDALLWFSLLSTYLVGNAEHTNSEPCWVKYVCATIWRSIFFVDDITFGVWKFVVCKMNIYSGWVAHRESIIICLFFLCVCVCVSFCICILQNVPVFAFVCFIFKS